MERRVIAPPPDVPSLLAAIGAATGPALTFVQGRSRVARLSHAELAVRVAGVAGRLHALGVRPGDRVAVLSANRLEVPVVMLAAMRLGAIVVPLNPAAPPEDRAFIVAHAGVGLTIADPALRSAGALAMDEVAADATALPPPPPADAARLPAIVLYTSGTTGQPKGVALSQAAVIWNGWSMARAFRLARTTQLAVLPLYHAHAFGFGLMSALATGGHLVFCDRFDPFAWPEVIRAEGVRVTSVVPSLLPALLETRVHRSKVPLLRHLLVSSAPLTAAAARQFEEATEIPLVQGWGLSEYTNFACCLDPFLDHEGRRGLLFGDELTSVGGPLPGTEVKVAGADGAPLGPGQRGELCVRGPSLMLGYFRDVDATHRAIDEDGWLHTGDEGLFREGPAGPGFAVTGRIKEIIIRGGEKVSPLAVERKLLARVPELEGRLVVVGFAHQTHGEEIGAYVELPAPSDEVLGRLRAAAEALPVDLRPKVVYHGGAPIPRTHTGKIQRRKLQPLFAAHGEHRGPMKVMPRS